MTIKADHPLSRVPILVIDDDAVMCRLVREMLIVMGFKDITVAKNGESGIREMRKREYDVVICDWKMKPMDGLEFIIAVRSTFSPPKRFVPIIMLTGKGERHDVEVARDAGVTEYLIKPFTPQNLYERIKTIVERPRQFVVSAAYKGPDRRRKLDTRKFTVDRRKRKHEYD